MKYRKYLVFIVLLLILGTNKIYADTYHHNTNGFLLKYETSFSNKLAIDNNDDSRNGMMTIAAVVGANGGCEIFGSKSDPDSLSYLINEILMYPKYIVPALVIGLGTLDFAKAIIASKEDEMKKAQATFIKRVIIGISIFFVPLIINIIMYLADIVWNGAFTTCGI